MARWLLAFILTSAAFAEQQSQTPKFEPNDPAAWQNAVRGSMPAPGIDFTSQSNSASHFALPPLTPGALPLSTLNASRSRLAPTMCAIPLIRVPADAKIDPGIRLESAPSAQALDNMPHAKAMPACPEEHPGR